MNFIIMIGKLFLILLISICIPIYGQNSMKIKEYGQVTVKDVFERVRSHDFHPLDEDNSMTMDRNLGVAGIADLGDGDWRVRLLAVRDLVRAGTDDVEMIKEGLTDQSVHVRQISAMNMFQRLALIVLM